MPPLKTWLIRHGESTANAGLPAPKHADSPLTERGIAQSRITASKFTEKPNLLVTSPLLRSRSSAKYILDRWPDMVTEIWPIQEFTYLSPTRCLGTTARERQPLIQNYWDQCDPGYVDGEDAESFAGFIKRLQDFHSRLLELDADFVAVVGHGQFLRAYSMALDQKIQSSPDSMRNYRQAEVAQPMKNGDILELSRKDLARVVF